MKCLKHYIYPWYHIWFVFLLSHLLCFFNEHEFLLQFPQQDHDFLGKKFGEFSAKCYWFLLYFPMTRTIPSAYHPSRGRQTEQWSICSLPPIASFCQTSVLDPCPCIYIVSVAVSPLQWQAQVYLPPRLTGQPKY